MSRRAFISARLRRFTAERARHRCEYCWLQQELCPESFEVDHIIPPNKPIRADEQTRQPRILSSLNFGCDTLTAPPWICEDGNGEQKQAHEDSGHRRRRHECQTPGKRTKTTAQVPLRSATDH